MILTLLYSSLFNFLSFQVLQDVFLLVKIFTGKVYWVPVDDPSSSQSLDISALSDPVPGIYYNNISDQVLLPENNNIWQMSVFDDTKTLFKDVGKLIGIT